MRTWSFALWSAWLLLIGLFCLACGAALAAAPSVTLARADAGLHGARVPPNLLLNLSLTHAAAAAAHGGDYAPQREYLGYFHARMCYSYPYRSKDGVMLPDLRVATAYFSVLKPADALHGCGGDSFSGNFLNWASASMLDIVRYALTGGDRVIDEVRKTVLQRAWLPDAGSPIDFYAHPVFFPRKVLQTGVAAATPFALAQLAIVSCRNRLLFGDASTPPGGSCDAPGFAATHGMFLARVRVCDADEGPLRDDLCLAYGKNYKPVGAMQRHGGRVRVGVFGHLNGVSASAGPVYGGVLRAPLAHVGRLRWTAPDFLPQDNAGAEWNPATGVYMSEAAGPGGGVTAYINGLGRGNAGHPGAYASAAPLAELLYESLRYLQGRQASAAVPPATAPPAIDGGLPVVAPWSDPQTASCQRHIVVSLGDAGMAGDRYVPGNVPVTPASSGDRARAPDGFAPPPFDAMAWTHAVGSLESGGAQGNPAPRPDLAALELLADGMGGASYHAAGLAYWSHMQALRPGGKNDGLAKVEHYAGDLRQGDPAGESAATPAATPLLLTAKYGGFLDANGDANPYKSAAGNALEEWSLDGRWPAHYLPGSDPAALIAGLRAAFAAADKGSLPAALAGPALMALANGTEEAYWFQTQLRLADGSMTLSRTAFAVGADGALLPGKPRWRAGGLDKEAPDGTPAALRPVYTLDAKGALMPLAWTRLDAEQRGAFDGGGDGRGEARLAYLLGQRAHEAGQPGGFLRRRSGSLGAAPYGNLVYVGAPGLGMPGAGYGLHRQALLQRRKMLYAGANDGLLHAFDARTGSELFAYLPQALLHVAAAAASTHYSPGPLLDGAAATAEVLAAGHWKTVLVSGMGGGAQGVFALDITDPARFAQDGALWEFTDRDDRLMGNVRAPPAFARINMGAKEGAPAYRDFAIVASGYNNYVNDGKDTTAPASAAAIFLLALDKAPGTPWMLGSNYFRLKVPVAGGGGDGGHDTDAGTDSMPQALGPPAVVPGGDGALAYMYAGDLQGNIWRLDLAGGPPWKDGQGRKLVFVARDAQGRRQPVTQQLNVAYAPGGGYLLLFGTGKLAEAGDTWPSAFLSQSFYAVHDDVRETSPTRSRADLEQRSLGEAAGGVRVDGAELRYTGSDAMRGWYLDFLSTAQTGERGISSPVLAAGKVLFNTVLPGRDACARPATRLYVLDVLSGFAADGAGVVQAGEQTGRLFDGLARAPPLALELSSTVGAATAAGRAEGRKELAVLQPGLPGAASGAVLKVVSAPLPARRLSWREVANWRELHEAAKKK
ncbi:hypothetical protein IGS61_27000 [Janthinobacterium sp. FW305-129]|uniref:pilus assembly protein n=1 Tax=Janthinobacterium sp. FW305-129 TaxID=2775054 RepID=UPI001E3F2581|nr:PilC/PilY family type IV pilus protein [Janthinobacterium sp. FW305-129]MCC7601163.1 hypothetical protein [Janthinobacterium sp. FW305-129]